MNNNGYFISTGDKNGFYTLRKIELEPVYEMNDYGQYFQTGISEREIYFQNLSTDRDEAIRKAKEITGFDLQIGFDLTSIARLKEEEYARLRAARAEYLSKFDASIFHGGKYKGCKIADVFVEDRGYVRWFSNSTSSNDEIKLQVETCKALMAPVIAAEQSAEKSDVAKYIHAFGVEFLKGYDKGFNDGSFLYSVTQQLLNGSLPSPRALEILIEVWAKAVGGRRNSKAYNAAINTFAERLAEI